MDGEDTSILNSSFAPFLSTSTLPTIRYIGNGTSVVDLREYILASLQENQFVVIGLYVPVFLLALISNVLVILVVIKDQYMRNVTNYFLVNLSVADLLVTLVCMPNAAWRAYTAKYDFGEYPCKISSYLQCISVASSIFTITAMAIDRYIAITKPFGFAYRSFSKRTTIIVIFALWLLSSVLFFPIVIVMKLNIDMPLQVAVPMCAEDWTDFPIPPQTLGIVWFIFMFAVPGFIMLFAYSMMGRTLCSTVPQIDKDEGMACTQQRNKMLRGRKRVACILLLLAFVFAICWLPYHIINLRVDTDEDIEENHETIKTLNYYTLLLGHVNSALNPIIYSALSQKFRRSIKDLICIEFHRLRGRQPLQWTDRSGSSSRFRCLTKIKAAPTAQNQVPTHTKPHSSQKTTKTCTV